MRARAGASACWTRHGDRKGGCKPPTAAPTLTCQVRSDDAVITRSVGSGRPARTTARQHVEDEAAERGCPPRWRPTARKGSIPDGRWVSTLSQMIPKTVIDEAPSTATRTYRSRADPRPAPPRTARLRDGASSPVPPTSPTASCPGPVRCQSGGPIQRAPDRTPVPYGVHPGPLHEDAGGPFGIGWSWVVRASVKSSSILHKK